MQPNDLASLWNVALVHQKAIEIVSNLSSGRRTSQEIIEALEHLQTAQK